MVSKSRCIYTCPVASGMRLRHKWFERSDLNLSRKRFEFGGLVFHDRIAVQPEKTHEVSRYKQAQRECVWKGSLLSLPQSTCTLSQAQLSFTSLINHMNRSNVYIYYHYFFYFFLLKLQKWFSQEQWETFSHCCLINMNGRHDEYWTASPLRPKSGSNILLHMHFLFHLFTVS